MEISSSVILEISPQLERAYSRTPRISPSYNTRERLQGLPDADLLWDLGIIPYDTVLARRVRHFMRFPDINYRWEDGKFKSIDQFSNDKGALGHYVVLKACIELDFFPICNTENGAGADIILPHHNALIEVRNTKHSVKLTGSRVTGSVHPRYDVLDSEHKKKHLLAMPAESPIVESGADELKRSGVHALFFPHQIRCQADIDPAVDAVKFQLRCLLLPIEGSQDLLGEPEDRKKLEKSFWLWLFEAFRSGFHRMLDRVRPSGSSPYLPFTPSRATTQRQSVEVGVTRRIMVTEVRNHGNRS